MAKYTVTIKSLIDNNFNFGLNSYPIFDENYRSTLNNNILNHYYINEIGFETANLFKFYLNQTMSEIMPAYNVLYQAQKHLIDNNLLFNNVNISENLQGADSSSSSSNSSSSDSASSNNSASDLASSNSSANNSSSNSGSSSSSSNSSGSANSKSLLQDTPQGQLSNTDINNPSWATNLTLGSNSNSNSISDSSSQSSQSSDSSQQASQSSNNSNSSSSSSSNSSGSSSSSSSSNNSYIKSIVGNNGSISNIELLNLISNNFYSIDLKIIHDLRDLFMLIF